MKLTGLLMMLAFAATSHATTFSTKAWQAAVQLDKLDEITAMLDQGGDVNLGADSGKTALMAAVKRGDLQLAQRLLGQGADVNAANRKGGTVLMYAMLSNDPKILRAVLDDGASLDELTVTGWSALMIGCAKGYTTLVDLLIVQGADINQADIYGWTPLIRAASQGHARTVARLLQGEDLNLSAQDETGKTALHHAALSGNRDIAALLLSAGVAPRIEDRDGYRAMDLADQAGDAQLVETLRQASSLQ